MIDMKLVNNGLDGIVLMKGRLDSNSSPEAERILRQLPPKFENLTLDIRELDYISSAGLRIVKILHSDMVKKGGQLIIAHPTQMVMEVFELVGFSGLLNIQR